MRLSNAPQRTSLRKPRTGLSSGYSNTKFFTTKYNKIQKMSNETIKVGDKVRKKSLSHMPADDTVLTVVRIEKTPLENGYYDSRGSFWYTGGEPTNFVMRAELSDGDMYGLTNLIKV